MNVARILRIWSCTPGSLSPKRSSVLMRWSRHQAGQPWSSLSIANQRVGYRRPTSAHTCMPRDMPSKSYFWVTLLSNVAPMTLDCKLAVSRLFANSKPLNLTHEVLNTIFTSGHGTSNSSRRGSHSKRVLPGVRMCMSPCRDEYTASSWVTPSKSQ